MIGHAIQGYNALQDYGYRLGLSLCLHTYFHSMILGNESYFKTLVDIQNLIKII